MYHWWSERGWEKRKRNGLWVRRKGKEQGKESYSVVGRDRLERIPADQECLGQGYLASLLMCTSKNQEAKKVRRQK